MTLTRRQLLAGLGGATAAAGAGAAGLWAWRRGPSLRSLSLGELGEQRFDVCVIGTGPAGSVVARELVDRGARVVMLESGFALERMAEFGFDPGKLDKYRVQSEVPYPIYATRLRALGGASNLWTGRCPRLHPIDFEKNAYTPQRNPWPLRYADLEPWYERAERTLRVQGGELSDLHAPRRERLPGGDSGAAQLRETLAELDLQLDPSPISQAPRFRDGPVRTARDLLPALSSELSLVTGATVVRLEHDDTGQITAADARGSDGAERRVRADAYVIACGTLESTRLLMLSTSPRHPAGLGNRSGQLGRGFNEHPNLTFLAQLPEDTSGSAIARCHQFYDSNKQAELGSAIYVFETTRHAPRLIRIGATLEMAPEAENRLALNSRDKDIYGNPGLQLSLRWTARDLHTLAATRTRIAEYFEVLGASEIEERAVSWSHHPAGTCRMGDDPAQSVVDAQLRVHGTRNLFVLSAASFVTAGASHPTLTIVALAHRLGNQLGHA